MKPSRLRPRIVITGFIFALFVYLGLYTWNSRTGFLDSFAARTGLEVVGWILRPGDAVARPIGRFFERYFMLIGVREENDKLREEVGRLTRDLARLKEAEAEVVRLHNLLNVQPLPGWSMQGARVVMRRFGPNAVLRFLAVDKGEKFGVDRNTAVIVPQGVIGRVVRTSLNYAQVLTLTDPNSHLSVIGQDSRNPGIVTGMGPGAPLQVLYVPVNKPLIEGEILVTSGMVGVFPKGLPVGRVVSVGRSGQSFFQTVTAIPLADPSNIEEVMLIKSSVPAPAEELPDEKPQNRAR